MPALIPPDEFIKNIKIEVKKMLNDLLCQRNVQRFPDIFIGQDIDLNQHEITKLLNRKLNMVYAYDKNSAHDICIYVREQYGMGLWLVDGKWLLEY